MNTSEAFRDIWKNCITPWLSPLDVSRLRAVNRWFRFHTRDTARIFRRCYSASGVISIAALGNWIDIVQLVLDRNGPQPVISSALEAAASKGHSEIIQLLIASSIQANLSHPLATAAAAGHLHVVELLLKAGATSYAAALQAAARGGHLEIVKLLIDKG